MSPENKKTSHLNKSREYRNHLNDLTEQELENVSGGFQVPLKTPPTPPTPPNTPNTTNNPSTPVLRRSFSAPPNLQSGVVDPARARENIDTHMDPGMYNPGPR